MKASAPSPAIDFSRGVAKALWQVVRGIDFYFLHPSDAIEQLPTGQRGF